MWALVDVLDPMPKSYPDWPRFVRQFREVANKLAQLQGEDGLWRSDLLDFDAYDLPGVSGSPSIPMRLPGK